MPFLSNHSSENKLKEICLPTPLPLLKRSGKIVEGSLDLTGFRNTEEIGVSLFSFSNETKERWNLVLTLFLSSLETA